MAIEPKYKFGYHIPTCLPMTVERVYKEPARTAVYTPDGEMTVNQIYERANGLLHLHERIRTRLTGLELYREFLYLPDENLKNYGGYDYQCETLEETNILRELRLVMYKIQPMLQSRSLVGTSKKGIEHDPNYYEGFYVLNDNNDYTILKCKDTFKLFRGIKHYYPDWDHNEDLLHTETIDFSVYNLSYTYNQLRNQLTNQPHQSLRKGLGTFQEFFELESNLNEKLVSMGIFL
ncbi:hypothetical protein ACFVS2_25470 [Brevibacillus sp. NPDC058079]|uniref:hypothetical protein n=1 Tax=Brevibacillus sp. NPDC058079 TaxID=3346330 RepID=UPI0036E6DA81